MSTDELALKVGENEPVTERKRLTRANRSGSLSFGAPWERIMGRFEAKVKQVAKLR
jgi:hypothetical protein